MRDITNEVKDFKKYLIVPRNEVAMEIHSANAADAMSCFAWAMDSDMNRYFKASCEEDREDRGQRDLAKRLDEFMKNYDPYEYADNDGSLEDTELMLLTSPMEVIEGLLSILEDLDARGQI